ncbi:MAG TPA: hypothetical protein VMR86_16815 [Myxococcota bacterium]|nr:hypothetical protein [Myxococcota bacterium]
MVPEDSTARWIDLLCAQRAGHLERLHAVERHTAFTAIGLAVTIAVGAMLGTEELWDASFRDSPAATGAGLAAVVLFAAACLLVALGLHQERRGRRAAIACLDRAIPELVAGGETHPVLSAVSARMREIAPPGADSGSAPYLPSQLDTRWLGSRAYTKVCLGCAALLLAALLAAAALTWAVPTESSEEDDYGNSAANHGQVPVRGPEAG